MASGMASYFGLAKQTAKGTPNTTDNNFKYLLFNNGGMGPQSQVIPLDPEVGGGAFVRDMKKVGVMSGGAFEFIPRPDTIAMLLTGALGKDTSAVAAPSTTAYNHVITPNTDQFDLPYFTVRVAPGNMWGEQYQDVRVASLGLNWKGSDFVRAQASMIGGLPAKVATTSWAAAAKVDGGPAMISPVSAMELPTATPAKVLSGGLVIGNSMPMDQQWVVGSYSPDGFDVTTRAVAISMVMKVADATLYSKMAYDPAGGSAWAASLMREGDIKIDLVSDIKADAANNLPYKIGIRANGSAGDAGNVVWSVQPIALRPDQQVVMAVTGMFLADAAKVVEVTVTNLVATAY